MGKTRNVELDILKGLSIIAVVLGHTNFAGTHYIYLFHMAVFFMASGFFFNTKSSDSIKNVGVFLKKRIIGLWLPFVIWNTLYTLLNNVFIKLNIYTDNEIIKNYVVADFASLHKHMSLKDMAVNIAKGLFMAGHTELGGAFWFLRVLFYISVAYVIADFILKKIFRKEKTVLILQGVISAVLLAAGYFMSLKKINTFSIDLLCSCYCLYYLGCLASKIKAENMKLIFTVLEFTACAALLYVLGLFGSISIGNNTYVNPLYMLATSLLGWFMLLSLSRLLKRVSFLRTGLSVIGKNSIFIVIFHFLSFKLVNLLIVLVKDYPKQVIAAFPVVTNLGWWWVLYAIVGTAIPVGIGLLWAVIKAKFKKENA